ncbi:hypothetical protein RHOSPDRAFT_33881 [Rhodotorula sp. JG-1b]|nr:hypothetical protein RHOSPDRAFT_33881 [Rhodotorula sp. JG-1b]
MEALSGVKSSQQLAGLLSAYIPLLAREGNPYAILRKTIRDVVLLPQSKAAEPLYILGSVGAAVDVLLFVAVWFIRWRKNSFWLVRKATSQDEVYYLAHSSLPYSGLNILMCLGLQGFAWCMYSQAKGIPVPMSIYWTSLCWLPGILGLLLNCYVMGTAYILHLRSYADKRAPRFGSPWVLLGTLIATAIAFLASSLPPAVKSAKAYSDTMLDWMAIDEMLGEAASLYAGTASTSSAAVANSVAPRLFELIQRKQRLYHLFRFTYLLYAAWAFLLGGIFCVLGVAYVRAVKRSLNEFKDRSPTASTVFSQTVRNLIALLLGFTLFIVVVSVNSVWVGILSAEVLDNGPVMQLSAIIPLLAAVFGILVIALTMFYQALTAPTVYVPPSLSRTSTFLRSRSQSYLPKESGLAAHFTRFALAASEFLPDHANLTLAGDVRDGGRAGPFEDLELQPANDAESIKSVEAGERQNRGKAEGIAVHRQAVTVVSLPRDGLDEVTDEKY